MNKDEFISTDIDQAIETLKAGGLVGLPTETVYGLAADASNPDAVARIFALKERPSQHPLILHVANDGVSWKRYGVVDHPVIDALAAAFWAGAMTLILKKTDAVSPLVTGGKNTVGLRVPQHPVAEAVLRESGPFLILEGGASSVGIESTIVDASNIDEQGIVILRLGQVTQDAVEGVAKAYDVAVSVKSHYVEDDQNTVAAGSYARHYAPNTPSQLVHVGDFEELLWEKASKSEKPLGILAFHEKPDSLEAPTHWVEASNTPSVYAQTLYAHLRDLDALGCSELLIEAPPEQAEWRAILDRLRRATHA
jgi:L-threonylcarbamoyladenylate synthase